jgi:ABC-type ATPase involved in cell division
MLVVTHEQYLVERFDNRVITINDGLISSDRMGGHREYEDK